MFKRPINRREVMQTTAQARLALAVGGAIGIESAWVRDRGPALLKVGSVLQLPDLKLLDASTWSAANVQAKTLVLYWWAGWCRFCAVQSPHIEALWHAWKDKGREGKVVFAEAGKCSRKILKV